MNTSDESLQSQQAKAIPDPRGVLSQLLGEVKVLSDEIARLRGENLALHNLVAQTRDIQLGQAAHMEELEKKITRLESGGF